MSRRLPLLVRIESAKDIRYEGSIYNVALNTGEVVECLANGKDLYELEEMSEKFAIGNNCSMQTCYVSSYPLTESIIRKGKGSVKKSRTVIIENSNFGELHLGTMPYHLCVTN